MTDVEQAVDRRIDAAYRRASQAMVHHVRAHCRSIVMSMSGPVAPVARAALEWLASEATKGDAPPGDEAPDDGSRPLIDYVAAHYPAFLRGEKSGAAILLKPPGLDLWEGYFSAANRLYDVHNALAADGLAIAWDHLPPCARVLELGAGTGGGTAALMSVLDRVRGGRDAQVTISDAAPHLLVRAMERLRLPADRVRRLRLDFNRPLDEQGVADRSADAIVAINALHAAVDLPAALDRCRRALVPDGVLVVSESLCGDGESVHQEFVFNLLAIGDAVDGVTSRFLTAARWRDLLASRRLVGAVGANRLGPEIALLAVVRSSSGEG